MGQERRSRWLRLGVMVRLVLVLSSVEPNSLFVWGSNLMAKLHITEFSAIPLAPDGKPLWLANISRKVAQQVVTYTTTTQSQAFKARTSFIRVYSDAKAFLQFSSDPVATIADMPLAANSPEYFAVDRGDKVAAYDGSS